jgi:hypothetical protein
VVAVALHQGSALDLGQVLGIVAGQQLAEGEGLLAQAHGVVVLGEQVAQLVAQDRRAAGLQPDDVHPVGQVVGQVPHHLAQLVLGRAQHAEGDHGQPQHNRRSGISTR